jgi:hypothetical protein
MLKRNVPTRWAEVITSVLEPEILISKFILIPLPSVIHIEFKKPGMYVVEIVNSFGKKIMSSRQSASIVIDVQHKTKGLFIIIINRDGHRQIEKVVKL